MYRYIIAMSDKRKEVKAFIKYASKQIIKHIIKLLYYPDHSDFNHWKSEIYNFLNDVPKLKKTHAWPSDEFIRSSLSVYNDAIEGYVKQISREYGQPKCSISDQEICEAVVEYQKFISDRLSKEGVLYKDEVYQVLDDLVNKYS